MSMCRTLFATCLASCHSRSVFHARNASPNYTQFAEFTLKAAMEQLGLPPKPKKPLSPYFKFMGSIRPKVVQENPNSKVTEIARLIGAEWSHFSDAGKKDLQRVYVSEMKDYMQDMIKYDKALTPQQRALIQETKSKGKAMGEKGKLRQKEKDLNKPKRPATGYGVFMDQQRANRDQSIKYKDWFIQAAAKWNQLTDEEKKIYYEESNKLMEHYNVALKEWEEQMIRQGHTDVVRERSLITKSKGKSV